MLSLAAAFAGCAAEPPHDDATTADDALRVPPGIGTWGAPAPMVLTQHNDIARSGWNERENVLTPRNVGSGAFGRIANWQVEGQVFAQPLYVSTAVHGKDALIVATEDNWVYALDAQATTMTVLWKVQLAPPVDVTDPRLEPTPGARNNVRPHMGITGTPVIDPIARRIYVVSARTETDTHGTPHIAFFLHALSLLDGHDVVAPKRIQPTAPGTTDVPLRFFDELYVQRAALLLSGNDVVVAFASNHSDFEDTRSGYVYYGWVLGFDKTTLEPTATFVTTPEDSQGGVWQGGNGPAADRFGNVFVESGNNLTAGAPGYGNSLIQLARVPGSNQYGVVSFFTPQHADSWVGTDDTDFGSSGPVLLPGSRTVLASGKSGVIYPRPVGALGGRSTDDSALVPPPVPAALTPGRHQVVASPTYWHSAKRGTRVFAWPEAGVLLERPVLAGDALGAPSASGPATRYPGSNGAPLAISSNGFHNGVLWANVEMGDKAATLVAYDADDISRELWSSDCQALPGGAKMMAPTVAGGRVFLGMYDKSLDTGTAGYIAVYGLHPPTHACGDGLDAADAGADAAPFDPAKCFDGRGIKTDWPTVFTDLFARCSSGTSCHGKPDGGGPKGLSIWPAGSADATYKAFTDQVVSMPFGDSTLVDRHAPASSRIGDVSKTPLSWIRVGGEMPADPSSGLNPCYAAEVEAWLASITPTP